MNRKIQPNPAEIAAQKALDKMLDCIQKKQNFRVEAGAGAGKTYSLVEALRSIIDEQSRGLLKRNQQVACITYTNVATNEIVSRTDGHPVIYASTIHSFCWDLIKGFQPILRKTVSELDVWSDKLQEIDDIGSRIIDYDLGYRRISDTHLYLHHDDVLTLTVALMEHKKFRQLFEARFPILFIDEYQDTNIDFANSVIQHFIEKNKGPLVGLFGDSWQKIYGDGRGLIVHENLTEIGKESNFRSKKNIVDVLNKIRPDLPQKISSSEEVGSAVVYHSNEYDGIRKTGTHWGGDLPSEVAHSFLEEVKKKLAEDGWDFAPDKTKILMLTHKVLAQEQGYEQIVNTFRYNDSFIKKEDPHIAFLVDTVEPACAAFSQGLYGEMFSIVGARSDLIKSMEDKKSWSRDMRSLLELRDKGTVGEVIDLLKKTGRPRLNDAVSKTEMKLTKVSPDEIKESLTLTQINKLRQIPYSELIALSQFVNDHTPFSTKHGVKGAEFDNVLVVLGRGWNHYNWNQFLEWFPDHFPADKMNTYERNRNLFYVSCSRPKKRLALLFTQKLSETAISTLDLWFSGEQVKSLNLN